jgi:hypothetical protein
MKVKRGQKLQKLGAALVLILAASVALIAQTATPPPQTFSTTIYLDYRFFLSSGGPITLKPTDPMATYLSNQFVFRRAYFTYENKINDNLKFRFRFDADNTANVTGVNLSGTPVSGVSLSKDDKLRPFMKHLYFEWSNFLVQNQTLTVGMEETLTFKLAEDVWNYRSVAKTLTDGYKDITGEEIDATSADIGVSLKGNVVKQLRYGIQMVNGGGYTHLETDKYKKFEGYLHIVPVAGFSVFGYIDTEKQQPKTVEGTVYSGTAYTYKLDSYFQMIKGLVLAAEWFKYTNPQKLYRPTSTDPYAEYYSSGWSIFGRYNLIPDKLNAFARYDSYAPNSLLKAKDMTLTVVGLDWAPLHSSLKFQPNVWFASYKDGSQYKSSLPAGQSATDTIFYMTFFLSF